MDRIIERTITGAASNWRRSIEFFYPAYGKNGFNERNITYQFAKEFELRKNSCSFMEVPYHNPKKNKFNKRIDCLVLDKELVVFAESKRLYNSTKIREIENDTKRLNKRNTTAILNALSRKEIPADIYVLILAETWQESVVDWWNGRESRLKWDQKFIPSSFARGSIEIISFDNTALHWLYAYKRLE